MNNLSILIAGSLAVLPFFSVQAAPVMIQPEFLNTSMTMFGTYNPLNVSNQVGLSQTYSSGITDFDTYASLGVTQATPIVDTYVQSNTDLTGTWDFDLGDIYEVSRFLLWNAPTTAGNRIQNFRLYIDDTSSFSSATLAGTFTSSPSSGYPVASESFTFDAVEGRFVRLEITSNAGGPRVLFGEVAFGGELIPEPSALLLSLPALMLTSLRRRR